MNIMLKAIRENEIRRLTDNPTPTKENYRKIWTNSDPAKITKSALRAPGLDIELYETYNGYQIYRLVHNDTGQVNYIATPLEDSVRIETASYISKEEKNEMESRSISAIYGQLKRLKEQIDKEGTA